MPRPKAPYNRPPGDHDALRAEQPRDFPEQVKEKLCALWNEQPDRPSRYSDESGDAGPPDLSDPAGVAFVGERPSVAGPAARAWPPAGERFTERILAEARWIIPELAHLKLRLGARELRAERDDLLKTLTQARDKLRAYHPSWMWCSATAIPRSWVMNSTNSSHSSKTRRLIRPGASRTRV